MTSQNQLEPKRITRRSLLKSGVGSLGAAGLAPIGTGPAYALPWSPNPADVPIMLRPKISLDGEWKFQLDPSNAGEQEHWYSNPQRIESTISVPACWQAEGYGKPTGILKHDYVGPAWYSKEVFVPENWKGEKVELHIGGAFTYVIAYVNGRKAGEHAGFSTPFQFEITPFIQPGSTNLISLRVANARQHQSSIDTSKNDYNEPTGALNYIARWGGLYRGVYLEARPRIGIRQIAITTTLSDRTAHFRFSLYNDSESQFRGHLRVSVRSRSGTEVAQASKTATVASHSTEELHLDVRVPDAQLWSPDQPSLYEAGAYLYQGERLVDEATERFGMREIRIDGTDILLNGKPLYLRGYGDDSVYVISGTPPTAKEIYAERLKLAKEFGFNAVRFHSWTPTVEFFEAADEAGILVLAELPVTYAQYLLPNREFLRNELIQIIETYRNHPSWFSLALGNEFNLRLIKKQEQPLFLNTVRQFVELARQMDPTRIILSNDGYMVRPTDIVSLYHGFSTEIPTVKHEFGSYYCSLPDVSLIDQFTGVMEPSWLKEKRDWLRSNHILEGYPAYLRNSWRLLQVSRKANVENLRRMGDLMGYEYWLMTDYPAGTPEGPAWNWGWCDYFWKPKGGDIHEDQAINSPVLPLLGLEVGDRTMWSEQPKEADIFISNHGSETLVKAAFQWKLEHDGKRIAGGRAEVDAPLGRVTKATRIRIDKISVGKACKLKLTASVSTQTHTYQNCWDIWAFPRSGLLQQSDVPIRSSMASHVLSRYFPFIRTFEAGVDDPSKSVLIATSLDMNVIDTLRRGGKALVLAERNRFDQQVGSTYFPSTGEAYGIRIPQHPALDGFPNDGFPDLHFYNLFEGASQLDLPSLRSAATSHLPIIEGLRLNRGKRSNQISRFTILTEATVGNGRLLLCTMNIHQNLNDDCPEAVYLFDRLLRYVASDRFQPKGVLSEKQFSDLAVPYERMIHSL